MGKIIFSDLDGTLLRDDKTISPEDWDALQRALKQGHKFAIATGRSFESAKRVSDTLGLNSEGCYIVSYNGGHIYDCKKNQVLVNQTLSMDLVKELFCLAEEAGLYCQTYIDGKVVSKYPAEELEYYSSRSGLESLADEEILEKITQDPNKAIIIHLTDHDKLERFWRENAKWAEGKIDFVFSNRMYLEAMPHGISKANGVQNLAKILGVDISDTIAVGDEQNDISMIKVAGVGVAVQNAIPSTKAAADYVTKRTNNESAMTEILEKYVF